MPATLTWATDAAAGTATAFSERVVERAPLARPPSEGDISMRQVSREAAQLQLRRAARAAAAESTMAQGEEEEEEDDGADEASCSMLSMPPPPRPPPQAPPQAAAVAAEEEGAPRVSRFKASRMRR